MAAHPATQLLDDAGPTTSLPVTAQVLHISRAHCYELARTGQLPVRVLRLGKRWVVPTADLRRVVGLDPAGPGDAA